ncbi:MAG: HipA domain-containing protein [Fimbriimonadaceae bacterium]
MRASDFRRIDVADVYRGEALAGELRRTDEGTQFTYDAHYVSSAPFGGEGVSWAMPPTELPYMGHGESLPRFFANLAPEGARLAATVGRLHTSPDDLMTVLLAVGRDCVGDVRVVPAGSPLSVTNENRPMRLEDADFEALFWEAVGGENLDATSLPGMQDKASGGVVSFPSSIGFGNSPTIIKISPKLFPMLVENEAFFLGVAEKAGIGVNEWKLVRDGKGRLGLVLKRFDRVWTKQGTKLVHQEDLCQLLERYPWQKYRVKVSEVASAIHEFASSPRRETLRLLEACMFSYLIGNADLHAKNVSLYRRDGSEIIELTPGYDLLSTLPYKHLDTRMALSLDGRDDKFKVRHFEDFGERWEVPREAVRARASEIAGAVEDSMARFGEIGLEPDALRRIESVVGQRIKGFGL